MRPDEDFTWIDGERLVRYGPGALADAPRLLRERGLDGYVLLSTARSRAAAPDLEREAASIVDVPPGPVAEVSAELAERVPGGPLVALGGGRSIDVAKALTAIRGGACAAIPTTLSGAEMTRIHRLPRGAASSGGRVRPALVVNAPELSASQPLPGLAASAMNALGHAAEALWVRQRNEVCELAALRAAELIGRGLEQPEPDRAALALGALLAGYAIGGTALSVHHVLAQTLVIDAGVGHGEANAVVLPHTLRLMARQAPGSLRRLATALGGEPDPDAAVDRVAGLAARAGVTRLGQLGVTREQVAALAATAARRPELRNVPEPPDEAALHGLLLAAL